MAKVATLKAPTGFYMVFDCESVGLHGETFAVGWVVIDGTGRELASCRMSCRPDLAAGAAADREWVARNVPGLGPNCVSPAEVREQFWRAWCEWRGCQLNAGAAMAADCAWPVEARFLAACVDRDPVRRGWEGPYPLIDVASVRLAAGLDPLAVVDRLPSELPAHDPLADARQSARLLIEALNARLPVPAGANAESRDALDEFIKLQNIAIGSAVEWLERLEPLCEAEEDPRDE